MSTASTHTNGSGRQRLLVINQYYAPDQASTGLLAAEICSSLAEEGFEVHVVAGQPSYTPGAPLAREYEVMNGVHVHRVSVGAPGRERLTVRLRGYLRFLWGAWRKSKAVAEETRPDGIMTFHNPPLVGVIGAYLARKHGVRYTYVLYDIHPDIIMATGWVRLPRPIFWLWEALHRWVLRRAGAVVVLGNGMKRTLVEGKGVPEGRVQVVPLWGRPELTPGPPSQTLRQELGVREDDIAVLYAGNMGVMHSLDPILDAAALLRGKPVRFLFVGDGTRRRELISRIEEEGLDQVSFLSYQPEDRFMELVLSCDICLVALSPGMERLALPSRAYTFLSAGKPLATVMAADADVARQVTESDSGWNVIDGAELAGVLAELLDDRAEIARRGGNARTLYEARFRRDQVIGEYAKAIRG